MTTSRLRTQLRRLFGRLSNPLLFSLVLLTAMTAQPVHAQTHDFPELGTTATIEAENYSARGGDWPYAESCESCSGGSQLIFFQAGSWFDLKVNVPQLTNYTISMRVASQFGANVEVELINDVGASYLTTIYVPATDDWNVYRDTYPQTLALPSGVRTLRFTNPGSGANIDYFTVTANSQCDANSDTPTCENLGPYSNPMKGFGSSWDRKNEPWASVGFQYIEWGQFEPIEDNVFDWDYVEAVLDRPGTRGRHVILQFVVDWDAHENLVPASDTYRGPGWLLKQMQDAGGVGEFIGPAVVNENQPDRIARATDYNDPIFIAQATEAIDTLFNGDGSHPGLKNDPRTFIIQIGVLGFFGEWHNYPNTDTWGPEPATKQAIFDAYIANLGDDDLTQIRYPDEAAAPPQKNLGYTNGSATPTPHGFELGEITGELELWKNGPIGGEWPPSIEAKYWRGFFATRQGEFFLRQGGYSTMTPPEADEIASNVPRFSVAPNSYFMHLHRLMGYDFRVDAVSHLVSTDESGLTHIEVDLSNIGIAKFYKRWDVQLAVLDSSTGEPLGVTTTSTDIRDLMPGEQMKIKDSVFAPLLDPDGQYQIGLRILQPHASEDKSIGWKLEARHTYVELHSDIEKQLGYWDENNALQGGWNILADVDLNQE